MKNCSFFGVKQALFSLALSFASFSVLAQDYLAGAAETDYSYPALNASYNNVGIGPRATITSGLLGASYNIAIGNGAGVGKNMNSFWANPTWSNNYLDNVGPTGNTAVGSGSVAMGGQAFGVNARAMSMSDAVHTMATAVGAGAQALGTSAVAVGSDSMAGSLSVLTVETTALGSASVASVDRATAIGSNAQAVAANSVALGAGSVATRANAVEVGGRQITGLAAGTQANDAVTLSQVQSMFAGLGGGVSEEQILSKANAYTDAAIDSMRKEYSRAIASVAATPALPALAPGERAIAVGTGFYNGQQAIGVAIAQSLYSGAILNAGISSAGDKPVVRAGAAWKF